MTPRRAPAPPRALTAPALALAALLALTLVACGGSTPTTKRSAPLPYVTRTRTADGRTETLYIHPHHAVSSATTRHIETGPVVGFGIVLVNGSRYPLYAFVPDPSGPSACTGACAAAWPPLRITIEGTLDSSPVLEESLAGTVPDPEHHATGDRVATFAGYVVHSHVGDLPGRATGQATHSFGGHWYLISRSGALLRQP